MNELSAWTFFSLRTALLATLAAGLIATPLAYLLARRRSPWLNGIETLLTLPLVLPPTVVGYLLVVALGSQNPLIKLLFGQPLLFTQTAAVIAATVVILPLIYLPAKAAFAAVDVDLEDAARLYGANRLSLFWHVSLPLARRGVAAGLTMAFARALGEFGATVMVLGISAERTTLPIAIYLDYTAGESTHAWWAIGVLTAVSLFSVLIYNAFFREV